MKQGILTWSGTIFLIKEIAIFEQIRTAVVDKPIPRPFIKDVVTARVGHIPITCEKVGFSSIIPFLIILSGFIIYYPPF